MVRGMEKVRIHTNSAMCKLIGGGCDTDVGDTTAPSPPAGRDKPVPPGISNLSLTYFHGHSFLFQKLILR